MKKLLLILPAIAFLASCNNAVDPDSPKQKPVPPEVMNSNKKKLDIAVDKLASTKDPVCNMPVSAGITDTTSYNGKLYGFCAEGCKNAFAGEPSKYIKE